VLVQVDKSVLRQLFRPFVVQVITSTTLVEFGTLDSSLHVGYR